VVLFATTAGGQTFVETFDTYPAGPLEGIFHASGAKWHGWGNTHSYLSLVSPTYAETAPHSAEMVVGCDTVLDFDDMTAGNPMTAGRWEMTADFYIPGTFTGETYFIVMNEYNKAPYSIMQWALQLKFSGVTGFATCDCGGNSSLSAPMIWDQWITCKWDIDLDADWATIYYDTGGLNQSHSWAWHRGATGGDNFLVLGVDAIDLYPDGGVVPVGASVYIDNIEIVPYGGVVEPGTQYCDGKTTSGNPCPCANDNDGSSGAIAGCQNSHTTGGAVLSASGQASLSNDTLVFNVTGMEPSNSVMFFQAINNQDGAGLSLGDGIRCAGGNLKRLKVKIADAVGNATSAPSVISVRSAQLGDTLLAGDTRYYQVWGRDTVAPACGLGVNDSTTSNGYEITWLP